MNAENVSALCERIKLFRVSYAWKIGKRLFRATTVWGATSLAKCKADFARRNPHVIAFQILEEVKS